MTTREEVIDLIAVYQQTWPQTRSSMDDATPGVWFRWLKDLDFGEVDRALAELVRQGNEYPPSVATLTARARAKQTSTRNRGPRLRAPFCGVCGRDQPEHAEWCKGIGDFEVHPMHLDNPDIGRTIYPAPSVPMPTSVRDQLRDLLGRTGASS